MSTSTSPNIGLALGSGGWRGLAHIGVIKSLTRHGYHISSIAGSSAGALIGGLYALSLDIDRVETLFVNLKYKDVLFAFSDPSIKRGMFKGKNTTKFIEKLTHNATFADTLIPFRATATDLISGKDTIFSTGSLAFAIRASSSIPLIFEPVSFKQQLLIDGGIINPVPVAIAKTLKNDIVIGVNLYQGSQLDKPKKKINQFDVGMATYQLMMNQLAQRDGNEADLLIEPELPFQIDPLYRIENSMAAIKCGETAMDAKIPTLKRLLSSF